MCSQNTSDSLMLSKRNWVHMFLEHCTVSLHGRSALKANFFIRNLPLAKEQRHRISGVSVVSQTSADPSRQFWHPDSLCSFSFFFFLTIWRVSWEAGNCPSVKGQGMKQEFWQAGAEEDVLSTCSGCSRPEPFAPMIEGKKGKEMLSRVSTPKG